MRSVLIACGTLMLGPPAFADPEPTDAEIFRMKTECIKLGKNIFLRNSSNELSTFTSIYDEKTNRCYVILTYIFPEANRVLSGKHFALYDGEGRMIAYWSKNYANFRGETVSPLIAYDYIRKIMEGNTEDGDK
jgi:hypothetical protein